MNPTEASTEATRSAQLVRALFDEGVVPLAQARRAADAPPYFPLRPDPQATSYFTAPRHRVMRPVDYALHGGTAEGLLDALAELWAAEGEAELAALVPRLREIASALAEERAESDGTVDVLCYTLF